MRRLTDDDRFPRSSQPRLTPLKTLAIKTRSRSILSLQRTTYRPIHRRARAGRIDQDAVSCGEGDMATETRTLRVIEPATEKVMAELHEASVEEADAAVARAKAAYPAWKAVSPKDRSNLLRR